MKEEILRIIKNYKRLLSEDSEERIKQNKKSNEIFDVLEKEKRKRKNKDLNKIAELEKKFQYENFTVYNEIIKKYEAKTKEILKKAEKIKNFYVILDAYDFLILEHNREDLFEQVLNWDEISKSPYSNSFYNSNDISWEFKPENSLRIADHWNFLSFGKKHCKLQNTDKKINKLMLCQYKKGFYEEVI